VRATPVPLIVAGGKKTAERDAIQLAWNAIHAGAAGVDMGRNIFQSDCPVGMIRAVRSVVHDNASVDAAVSIYEQENSKGRQ
jgi:putative autoinducer-2 (AI-2) aldolase